jgi:hypothetical protein
MKLFREAVPAFCENHTVHIITSELEGYYYMYAYVLEVISFPGISETKSYMCSCFSTYAAGHIHLIIFYITVDM